MIEAAHPLLQLLIIALAAARVTVLLVEDVIIDRPRDVVIAWLAEHAHPKLAEGAECQRCLGFWVSAIWSLAWFAWPTGATIIAVPWGVAMLAWWFGAAWIPED